MKLPTGDMVKPRYRRPIKVGSPVAPSKAIIHQVNKKRPKPQTIPQVSENALTFIFILAPSFTGWLIADEVGVLFNNCCAYFAHNLVTVMPVYTHIFDMTNFALFVRPDGSGYTLILQRLHVVPLLSVFVFSAVNRMC
jgi:hypothetical protein